MWTNYAKTLEYWRYKMDILVILVMLLTSPVTVVWGQELVAEQSSTGTDSSFTGLAEYAVDGVPHLCSLTEEETDPWWRVRFDQLYTVTKITISKQRDLTHLNPLLEGMVVRVGSCTNNTESNTMCGNPVNRGQAQAPGNQALSFNCPPSTYGQYVFVDLPGELKILSMCEVVIEKEPISAELRSSLSFSDASYQFEESAGVVEIEVTRSGSSSSCASADVLVTTGSASSPEDFKLITNGIEFGPGEQAATISVEIVRDALNEQSETFQVILNNPLGAELGDISVADVKIIDSLPTTLRITTAALTTTAPTTAPLIPTTTPVVPTTPPSITTAPNVPTTAFQTTSPFIPTTPPQPTTAPYVPTTPPVPTTNVPSTPPVPTTAPNKLTTPPLLTTMQPTTPLSKTTPNVPTTSPFVTTLPIIPTTPYLATTPPLPLTTPNVPTTPPDPNTTPNIPTTAPNIPTTPNVITTNVPITTPIITTLNIITTIAQTTPNIETTTPFNPTTPNDPTTMPNIPTTTPYTTTMAPTTSPVITTRNPTTPLFEQTTANEIITTPNVQTTQAVLATTPNLPTTPNNPSTLGISTTQNVFTTAQNIDTTTDTTVEIYTTTIEMITTTEMIVTDNDTAEISTSYADQNSCPMETTLFEGFVLTWPKSTPGDEALSLEKCSNDSTQAGEPLGRRLCFSDSGGTVNWYTPTLADCVPKMDMNMQLARLAKLSVAPENIQEVSQEVVELTKDPDDLDSESLELISGIIESIVNINGTSEMVIMNVLNTFDNILEIEETEFRRAQVANGTASDLLVVLESIVDMLRTNGTNFTYTGEHISVEIVHLPRDSFDGGLEWSPIDDEDTKDPTAASISIPESVLDFTDDEIIGVSFVIYEDAKLFQSLRLSSQRNLNPDDIYLQFGHVISATVSETTIIGLPKDDPVVTSFTFYNPLIQDSNTDIGNSLQCVYWDLTAARGAGDWSSEGCTLASDGNQEAVCHCTHLTNFAILLDVSGGTHSLVLDLISKIGCAISIVALVITILSYLNIRNLRTKQPQRILLHLSFSLLGLYIVFLVGIEQTQWMPYGCTIIAALMHYFTLTSISWMAVEAINMYYVFVRAMQAQVSRFLLKSSIFAWGVPFVIVALVLGLDRTHYGNEYHCFVSQGIVFSFGVVFYIVFILLFNFVIFAMVMQRLTCGRKTKGTNRKTIRESWKRLQNAVTISVLLGLTWLFGFLAIIESATFAMQLIFCIFNSLQGLFIFLLFCLRPKEVRNAWRAWFSGSTIRRFSLSSYLNSSREKRSSSASTLRHRLSGIYRDTASKRNVSLGSLSLQSDNTDYDDSKRFSTFKGDESHDNPTYEINTNNHRIGFSPNENDEYEESESNDSGIPNGTIVEDEFGQETLIVTV